MYNNYYQQTPIVDERIWVQNEYAADAYLVAPSGFVRLWDANRPVFYEKRADATGRPLPIEVYDYKKRPTKAFTDESNTIDYKEQIDGILRRLDALERGTDEQTESNANDSGI